MDQELYT